VQTVVAVMTLVILIKGHDGVGGRPSRRCVTEGGKVTLSIIFFLLIFFVVAVTCVDSTRTHEKGNH